MTKHLFISDTQVKKGINTDHIEALGHYIVDKQPDTIIHIGDHWDMPSLSFYDKRGSKKMEGARYSDDIEAGNDAMDRLMKPLQRLQRQQRRSKSKIYKPRLVLTLGNHENRINRAIENDPVTYDGTISTDDFNAKEHEWEVHEFLKIVEIDGVNYSHYFINPSGLTGYPIGGTIDNKLRHLGTSFSMGHQQTLQWGQKFTADGRQIMGLVSGAFYSHDEDYLGPQGNKQYWRGVIMKHEVHEGVYCPMMVSMDYLLRRYM